MPASQPLLRIGAPGVARAPVSLPPLIAAAAAAPDVGGRNGVVYRELPCRSALNRCDVERMPFEWTINPYRGCEFGCRYCYARYTHEFIGITDTRRFETEIYAKSSAAAALERDLPPGKVPRGSIAIGTATDPYQPAERAFKITRGLLEVFARREGLSLSITTKSALVTRDIDLITAVAKRNAISVNMTITTLSRRLARILEPRAPRPALRLEAVRDLARAGIPVGVFIMPILPGITDAPSSLEALVSAAARGGASYVAHQVLFLRTSAKKEFFPFLAEHFPGHVRRYRWIYGSAAYYSPEYREKISVLMRELRGRYGLSSREPEDPKGPCESAAHGKDGMAAGHVCAGPGGQMRLGF